MKYLKNSYRHSQKQSVGLLHDESEIRFIFRTQQPFDLSDTKINQNTSPWSNSSVEANALVEKEEVFILEPVENKVEKWQPNKTYSTGSLVQWGFDIYEAKSDVEMGETFDDTRVDKN